MWLGLIMLVASAPCQICSLRYPGMTQPTAPGLGAWQSARLQVRALRLNGGGEAEVAVVEDSNDLSTTINIIDFHQLSLKQIVSVE